GAASPASAGMLAAQIEPTDHLVLGLGVRSRDHYEALAAALKDTTGIDIGFWRGGIASVALQESEVDQLREHVALQRQAGLRCDWLEPGDVHERWPGAAPECVGALFAPEDGAVDPQALIRALLADARRLGAAPVPTAVDELQTARGPVTPDGRPIIGPDPDVAGLYYATGHGRNGVLLAALTGEIIGDLLTKGETDVDLAPLSPTRTFTPITDQDILKPDV